MAKQKEVKTNAMRILESLKIPFTQHTHECEEFVDGLQIADKLSLPYEKVYKTLVTVGNSKSYFVFVVPIAAELDLKKAAKGGASAGVTTMTLQAALELADRNMVAAKGIQKALESENGLLQAIADSVGDKEAARFKKKVDNYARDGVFHRMKVNLLCRKQKDLVAVGQSLINNITSFFKVDAAGNVSVTKGSFMKGVYKNADTINAVVKGANPDGEKSSIKNLMGKALRGANTARKVNDFTKDARNLF